MKSSRTSTSIKRPHLKKTFWIAGILSLTLLASLAMGCGTRVADATESREDGFDVGEVVKIVVDVGNGSITVNEGTDGMVKVQATLRQPEELKYEVVQVGDTIRVESSTTESGVFNLSRNAGTDIDITAPSYARVELETSNGAIEINGMQRSGSALSSNGRIVLTNVDGDFDVTSSNGAVDITKARRTFDVKTGNGKIKFDGEILDGRNSLVTSNGGINVKLQGTPNVKVDASSSHGSVNSDIPITVASSMRDNHLVGVIGNGNAELLIEASNGSVMIQ